MKISIIGTGYVGLVSGACFAEKGHEVICVDVDETKVKSINTGIPPIHEKGLEELLKKHSGKNLIATQDLSQAVRNTNISIIAVGTPFDGEFIDLSFIKAAAKQIGKAISSLNRWHSVIVKSTVVPGTTSNIVLPEIENASQKKAGQDFGVGMNPEFLKEGEAINDFMHPDRIVLGGINKKTQKDLEELYACFPMVDKIFTDCNTAEMIKYAANSLLATLISFSNEIGNLCAQTPGVDVKKVMRGVHLDKRFMPQNDDGTKVKPGMINYLDAGCGFGGSCFPKDVKALVAHGARDGLDMSVLRAVLDVNSKQPFKMIDLLEKHVEDMSTSTIAVLGLAFKPGTDDIRESPSLPVLRELLNKGTTIKAFDPVASTEVQKIFPQENITYTANLSDAISEVDGVLLMTRWEQFKELPQIINDINPNAVLIDGRRMLDVSSVNNYDGIGIGELYSDSKKLG